MDFLTQLFDTSDFPARWNGGTGWQSTPWYGWLHILSDLGMWSAYLAIPCVLGYCILRRKDIPFRTVFLLFGAFILACGTTHLVDALLFWWPAYRLAGVVKLFAAVLSWATVLALIPVVPKVLAKRSPAALEREIAARRQAEERERLLLAEAAASNAKFRAFFEQGNLFAGIANVDGTILDPNRLSWEGCGYTRDQVVGKPFWDGPWWAPSALLVERIKAGSEQAAGGQTFRAEMPYFVADGTERMVDLTILPIKDETGHVLFLAPSGIDITDRKRAEEALRRSEERYRATVEHANIGVCNCLPDGKFIAANRKHCEVVGYSPEELLTKTWQELTHPDDLEADLALGSRVQAGEKPAYTMEKRYVRKDGSVIWVNLSGAFVSNAAGQVIQGIGVIEDITDRKEAAERLRKSEERFRLAAAAVNGIIYEWDLREGKVERTRGLLEVLGYQPDEVPATADWWWSAPQKLVQVV